MHSFNLAESIKVSTLWRCQIIATQKLIEEEEDAIMNDFVGSSFPSPFLAAYSSNDWHDTFIWIVIKIDQRVHNGRWR